MKKLAKIITVSAGIAFAGAAVWTVGCQKPHNHVYGAYESAGEEGHHRPAVCPGHEDIYSSVVPHNYAGGTVCLECGYAKKSETPDQNSGALSRADGLIIEGLSQNKINLTENYTSHSVDRNAVFVYLALNGGKISDVAVPLEDTTLTLTDPTGGVLTDWTNLRSHGIYTLTATVKAGDTELTCSQTIDINNPVLPETLMVKDGAVLSQPKSRNDYMTASWQYEISLQNGDKTDVDAASVKIEGLDTYTEKTGAKATLSCGDYSGGVTYDIVHNPDIHTRRYALNFDGLPAGDVGCGTVFLDNNDTKVALVTDGASVVKEVTETADRYFRSYLQLDGDLLITAKGETTVEYSYAEDGVISTGELNIPQDGTYSLSGNIKLLCLYITTQREDKNGEDLNLPDILPQLVKLTVNRESEEFRQRFISGDIFYISPEYSVIGTYIRGNLGEKFEKEVADGLNFYFNGRQVIPEETVLTAERFHEFGLATVTVESGGAAAFYEVYLARPPVTGVDGVAVTMSDGFEAAVFDVTETIRLTIGLFRAEVFASVPSAVTVEKAVCRPLNGNLYMELDEDGLEIGAGEYEIYVTGKIVQGYAEETFTETYPLTVTVDGSLKDFSVDLSSLTTGKITRMTLVHSERSGSVYVTATAQNYATCESCSEEEYTRAINLGGAGGTAYRSIKFCVRAESVITVTLSSQDYAEIVFSDGNGIISTKETDGGGELITLQFTAPSLGEFYLYSARREVNFYAAQIEYTTF